MVVQNKRETALIIRYPTIDRRAPTNVGIDVVGQSTEPLSNGWLGGRGRVMRFDLELKQTDSSFSCLDHVINAKNGHHSERRRRIEMAKKVEEKKNREL